MIICGLDPGTATTGFGIVYAGEENLNVLDYGLIETSKDGSTSNRLLDIYNKVNEVLKRFNPDIVVIEKVFFATNAKTAIGVGQAQGVMFLSSAMAKISVAEYAPGTIKKVVTGDGRADKKMVQIFVRKILGSKVKSKKGEKTHFDNSADALAIAICHAYKMNLGIGGDNNEG